MRCFFIIICLFLCVGTSFANDDVTLFNELTKLAKNGNPEAQYHLGMFYNNGIGTQKDLNKAFEWFKKSAAAGDPLGYYKLGCYYAGQGKGVVSTDYQKALEYKLVSAQAGYVRAQYDVASMYYHNKEVDKAIKWWEKSANQGYPDSVYALFAVYYEGKGVPNNLISAYGYLKIIEKNCGEENRDKVAEKIKELQNVLSQTQIEKAQNFANNWHPKQTDLTIKAYAGKEETRRLVESASRK